MEQKCRLDGSELTEVINLGEQYFTDFLSKPSEIESRKKCKLRLGIGETGLVQLFETLEPEQMYRHYWYRSGINETMVKELENIVECAKRYVDLNESDTVLDIASNDLSLLKNYNDKLMRIGIDPSDISKQMVNNNLNIKVVPDFFSSKNYWSVAKEKAKIITSIAVFYDLPDPTWFVKEIKNVLHDNGIWIMQLSYTPLMLEQNAFDNICHEHVEFYTLTVINNLLKKHGFKIINAELNDTNSGSCRVYITHDENKKFKCPEHYLQIGKFRTESILSYEEKLDLLSPKPYVDFFNRVEENKDKTIKLLKQLKMEGKKVLGYGASTKGNTLLQYYGITTDLIPCIAERTQEKWDKYTIGTNIPIVSEEEMRNMKPDYLFIFPWHFTEFFKLREKQLRDNGCKFIVPLPNVEII